MICNRGHIFRPFLFIFSIPILTLVHFKQTRNSHVDPKSQTKKDHLDVSEVIKDINLTVTKFEPSATNPLVVIILSSLPRSGSSMMGQLISSMDNKSVYFFEPNHRIKKPCMEDSRCQSEHLVRYYTCQASKRKECERASSRVIKLVRGSLEKVGTLLSGSQYELKMIHLTRDPRGALKSIAIAGWVHDPAIRCKEVNEDMEAYERFAENYPGKIMNVSYERFCVDSELYTKKIYKFLYSSNTLPEKTVEYMKTHMNVTHNGFQNTHRETSTHYQDWRKEIKTKLFYGIESEQFCQLIISKMGYNLFGTVEKVRDYNNSLFVNT